jgi:hypothetical protein
MATFAKQGVKMTLKEDNVDRLTGSFGNLGVNRTQSQVEITHNARGSRSWAEGWGIVVLESDGREKEDWLKRGWRSPISSYPISSAEIINTRLAWLM